MTAELHLTEFTPNYLQLDDLSDHWLTRVMHVWSRDAMKQKSMVLLRDVTMSCNRSRGVNATSSPHESRSMMPSLTNDLTTPRYKPTQGLRGAFGAAEAQRAVPEVCSLRFDRSC